MLSTGIVFSRRGEMGEQDESEAIPRCFKQKGFLAQFHVAKFFGFFRNNPRTVVKRKFKMILYTTIHLHSMGLMGKIVEFLTFSNVTRFSEQ